MQRVKSFGQEQGAVRIAQFSDCYRPRINGVTTSIQVLKQALEAEGHQVSLFAPGYPGAPPAEPGLHRWTSLYMPLQPEDRFSLLWPPAEVSAYWKTPVDVVHVHTPFNVGLMGWWKARAQRVPLVFTHHTLWEAYAHYLKIVPLPLGRWIGKRLCDFYFKHSDVVVLPSREIEQELRAAGRVKGRTEVIATGIYCQDFRGGEAARVRQELELAEDVPLFLYVGRIGKEKSLDFVLECFAEYRARRGRARLVLIGGGMEMPLLQAQARRLGLDQWTCFLGYRDRDQLKHYLAAARAFVFASETETQGLVILEAAAAGVPVLAVRASGVSEAVSDGVSGLLVDSGDREAFVQGMLRLENDEALWRQLSQGASPWADRFSAQEMARRMLELYASLGP